jgi:hypothetical protein
VRDCCSVNIEPVAAFVLPVAEAVISKSRTDVGVQGAVPGECDDLGFGAVTACLSAIYETSRAALPVPLPSRVTKVDRGIGVIGSQDVEALQHGAHMATGIAYTVSLSAAYAQPDPS